ncbi:hypothetical protein ACLOJK_028720 [Asimina triloba]
MNRAEANFPLSKRKKANTDGSGKVSNWKFDQDACERAMTRMIIRDELPFKFVEKDGNSNPPLEEDWKHAKVLCDCLAKFLEAMDILSGTKYTTSNLLFREFDEITESLYAFPAEQNNPLLLRMCNKMKEKLAEYWGSTDKFNIYRKMKRMMFHLLVLLYLLFHQNINILEGKRLCLGANLKAINMKEDISGITVNLNSNPSLIFTNRNRPQIEALPNPSLSLTCSLCLALLPLNLDTPSPSISHKHQSPARQPNRGSVDHFHLPQLRQSTTVSSHFFLF